MYWFIFWILFAVFVLMIAAFSRAGAKARVLASHPLPVIEKDEEGDRRAGWAVGTAIGITVITLFVILVVSVITGKRVEGSTSKNSLTIQSHRPSMVVGGYISKFTGGSDRHNRQ